MIFDYQQYLASREWALKREAVRKRAGNKCERCYVAPMQAVHHLTYANIGKEPLEDLQAICHPCHAFVSGKANNDPKAEEIKKFYKRSNELTTELLKRYYKERDPALTRSLIRVLAFVIGDAAHNSGSNKHEEEMLEWLKHEIRDFKQFIQQITAKE